MKETIKIVQNQTKGIADKGKAAKFGPREAEKALAFHESFPEYEMTPLRNLQNLAAELGLASIHVKDESYRFGLNAFKVLGGSYSIGNYIAEELGVDIAELNYEKIISPEVHEKLGNLTFVTATDGNHGRGIAWTANRLHQKSVVYMPKGSAAERLHNIQALGSDASITELNYDDTVRFAMEESKKNGWVLTQDTAWEGYEKIPGWIMQGYTTMAMEAVKQMKEERPTHIFLQAGVGAMAGALTAFFAELYQDQKPMITIVEPNKADCLFRTAEANDGKLHNVTGEMDSIMAGLCCGEPCTIAWEILKRHVDYFLSIPDYVTAKGMRILGNPIGNDSRIISGESGASTLGTVAEIMQNLAFRKMKNSLKLDEHAKILCFSTEGDTDQKNYRRVVWDGLFPSF